MKTINKEYIPYIEFSNASILYYIIFNKNKILVTENVFLQFFGVHKKEKDGEHIHYFIHYHDKKYSLYIRVTKDYYNRFKSFKSIEMRQENQFKNYRILYNNIIEDYEDWGEKLVDKNTLNNDHMILERMYEQEMKKRLYKSIKLLSVVQRRRLLLYYFKGYTYKKIAIAEKCSIIAVQKSIKGALKNLKIYME